MLNIVKIYLKKIPLINLGIYNSQNFTPPQHFYEENGYFISMDI